MPGVLPGHAGIGRAHAPWMPERRDWNPPLLLARHRTRPEQEPREWNQDLTAGWRREVPLVLKDARAEHQLRPGLRLCAGESAPPRGAPLCLQFRYRRLL